MPTTPAPTTTPTPAPPATPTPSEKLSLAQYADKYAGGPGAIYAGDLAQLAGPAPLLYYSQVSTVTLEALESHRWIYDSQLYQELLRKANLINSTLLASEGEKIVIEHFCITSAFLECALLESFFAPNLAARTKGQIEFKVNHFPGIPNKSSESLILVADGTLDSATVHSGHVVGEAPAFGIQNLWGIYSSREQAFVASQSIISDIEELVLDYTGGVILNRNWYSNEDQFLFCKERIDTLDGIADKKIRGHGAAILDWIGGMGASPRFVDRWEVYSHLERGNLDCGISDAGTGRVQAWYEVSDYMIGPLVSNFSLRQQRNFLHGMEFNPRRPAPFATDNVGGSSNKSELEAFTGDRHPQ